MIKSLSLFRTRIFKLLHAAELQKCAFQKPIMKTRISIYELSDLVQNKVG